VIDARGNVSHTTKLFVPRIVETNVTLTSGETPYVRYGEWVVFGSFAATIIAVGIGFARRRRGSVDSSAVHDPSVTVPSGVADVDTRSAERV
jgi:apolipoprotein N-acyltransferase